MNEKELREYLEMLTKEQVIEFTLGVLENEKALHREKLDKIQRNYSLDPLTKRL